MKKLLILLFLLCLVITSCAVNEARLYEDRFDELDIGGRFNELAYSIERGKTGPMLYSQAETIIEDLKYIAPDGDSTLTKINQSFIRTAELLIQAMDHKKAADNHAYAECYRNAKKLYNSTNKKLNKYKK